MVETMPVKLIGEHPLAKDEDGKLVNSIGDVFPAENTVITGPGIHDTLFLDYMDHVEEEHKRQGKPFTKEERDSLEDRLCPFVRLHMKKDSVLIRTDCGMDMAFRADEVLQQIAPKEKIKFMGVLNESVRRSVKKRGELWRINTLPKTVEEMKQEISESKTALAGRAYHGETGERYITYEEFEKLGELDIKELARTLNEIKRYSCIKSSCGVSELRFFMADKFNLGEYKDEDFTKWDEARLRVHYDGLKSKFWSSVKAEFRKEDLENEEFRKAMFSRLIGVHDDEISEEVLLGLSSEFYMHIQWLPGARIEHGEVIFDSVFEKEMPDEQKIYDEKVKDIILNLRREHGNSMEYINVGRIIGSSSKREKMPGRREVYIAVIKVKGKRKEKVKIIRMQKWNAVEYLQSGEETDIYKAICRAYDYERYILDRINGCRQLGMDLSESIIPDEVIETIKNVPTPIIYYVRDYIYGIASDKIPASKLEKKEYALRFARLLGAAAAPNIILGRVSDGKVLFDDGDEVVIEGRKGFPSKIKIGDMTSSFADYTTPLEKFAEDYAQPVVKRAGIAPDIEKFAEAYASAFVKRFKEIQKEYRDHKRAFNSLFNRIYDTGSFAFRWQKVLERLDNTDADALGNLIMDYIRKEIKD